MRDAGRGAVYLLQGEAMLDPGFVRDNREAVERMLHDRGIELDLSEFYAFDDQRRDGIREVEVLKHRSNVASKEIGIAVQRGEDVDARKEEMRFLKDRIKELDDVVKSAESKMNSILLNVPNLPNKEVPHGKSPADNVVVRQKEGVTRVDFPAKTHNVIGTNLGILDFERGAKIAG